MSFIKRLFQKKSKKNPPFRKIIRELKTTERILLQRQIYFERQIEKEAGTMRKFATVKKQLQQAALRALRRKQRFERQLRQISGALRVIEKQRKLLENLKLEKELMKLAKSSKNILPNRKTEKIDKIFDELAKQKTQIDAISDALNYPASSESNSEDNGLEDLSENFRSLFFRGRKD